MRCHELTISRVIDETPDARSFVLEVPPELKDTFRYRAGQFLTFRLELPGEATELLRCYSLSSAPHLEAEHKVTVKRVPGGRVSNWMNDNLEAGARVEVLPPGGRFVLRESSAPLLFFAGGSGITPVISLLKTALALGERRAHLFYANRDRESVIFHDELEALAERHPQRFSLQHHLDLASGFATAQQVQAAAAGIEDADAYLCGPGPFMEMAEQALLDAGFAQGSIFIERFESPEAGQMPAPALDQAAPHAASAAAAAGTTAAGEPAELAEPASASAGTTAAELAEPGEVPSEILVRIKGEQHRVPYQPGQSVLEAAIRAGLPAPYACREGHCGACAARCLKGEVKMAANEVFEEDELEEGWVLTCQARPSGKHCEISYDE